MDLEEFTQGKLAEYSYRRDPDSDDHAKLAPSSSEISKGGLSTHISRKLRVVHRSANVYRMAIALVEEEKALESFRNTYGGASEAGTKKEFDEFIERVRSERCGSESDDISLSEIEELLKPILNQSSDSGQSESKDWAREEPER